MRKLTILLLATALLSSCGKSKSGKALGEEICECSKKSNGMDPADPKREAAQKECTARQMEAWNKVKDDPKKADEFNAVLSKCAEEQIKSAFGK